MAVREMIEVGHAPIESEFTAGDPSLPTLVFLHEGLGSIDLWRGVPDELALATGGASTLVFARHGHGASGPAAMPRPVTYLHHEADSVLPAVLAAFGIDRPVLIGHSDGASIALLYAGDRHPVAGLVCMAPHVFVEPESISGIEQAAIAFGSGDMAERMGRYHRDPVATFRGWNDVWLSEGFRAWNIEDRLAAITAPVLAVQGLEDQYGTIAQIDAIEAGVSGGFERLVLEGVGHAPHLEARDAVVSAVAEFVLALAADG